MRGKRGVAVAQRKRPQVGAVAGVGKIVKSLAVGADNGVGVIRRPRCEAHYAGVDAVEFHRHSLVIGGILFFSLVALLPFLRVLFVSLGLLLSFLFGLLGQGGVLLAHHETVAGLAVQESNHHIGLRTPRRMVAHTVGVGNIHQCIPLGGEARRHVEVAVACDVGHFAGSSIHQGDIRIWIVHLRDEFKSEPARVGRPYEIKAVIIAGIYIGVRRNILARGEVAHGQAVAVSGIGHLLAVGRYARIGIVIVGIAEHQCLLHRGGIGEVSILLTRNLGLVDSLAAVAVRGIINCARVRRPGHIIFSLRSGGYLAGCRIFHRSDEHIAAAYERGLLSVGRHGGIGCRRHLQTAHCRLVVGSDGHSHFPRLAAVGHRIDFAIPGERHGAVVGA